MKEIPRTANEIQHWMEISVILGIMKFICICKAINLRAISLKKSLYLWTEKGVRTFLATSFSLNLKINCVMSSGHPYPMVTY